MSTFNFQASVVRYCILTAAFDISTLYVSELVATHLEHIERILAGNRSQISQEGSPLLLQGQNPWVANTIYGQQSHLERRPAGQVSQVYRSLDCTTASELPASATGNDLRNFSLHEPPCTSLAECITTNSIGTPHLNCAQMLQSPVNYVAQIVRQVKQACGSRPDVRTVQNQLHRRPTEYNKVISHSHKQCIFIWYLPLSFMPSITCSLADSFAYSVARVFSQRWAFHLSLLLL